MACGVRGDQVGGVGEADLLLGLAQGRANLERVAALAGARIATHELASKSGTPFSMNVGTSGIEGERFALDTAIGTRRPAFTCVKAPAIAV